MPSCLARMAVHLLLFTVCGPPMIGVPIMRLVAGIDADPFCSEAAGLTHDMLREAIDDMRVRFGQWQPRAAR